MSDIDDRLVHKKERLSFEGVDSNIFAYFAEFRAQAMQQGWRLDEVGRVVNAAQHGNYATALATIMDHCADPKPTPSKEFTLL